MPESHVHFLLCFSPSLKAKLAKLARQEHRSLNRQIEFLLERALGEELKEEAAPEFSDQNQRREEQRESL